MTAIEQYQAGNGAVAGWGAQRQPVANRTSVSLIEWAEAAKAAHDVSAVLVRTPFVPEAYRDNPYAATAAILAGHEVNLSPMASLNAFDVIQGRAAPKALTLRAIVQSAGHEVWLVESTEARAVVRGRRAGSSIVEESVWTIQRARTMKLADKAQWKLQSQAMLVARATSECCRLVAADAILGIPYSSEEISDDAPVPEQPAGEPAPQRTAQRRTAARPAVERAPTSAPGKTRPSAGAAEPAAAGPAPAGPPLPGEDGYDDPPTSPVEDREPPPDDEQPPSEALDPGGKSTVKQNRLMHALFREADLGGDDNRTARLHLTGLILDRELGTSAGLTVADAKVVIDALAALKDTDDFPRAVAAYVRAHQQRQAEIDAATDEPDPRDEEPGADDATGSDS